MSKNNTVSINIRGNRKGLRRELDGAQKDVSNFAKRSSQALSPLHKVGKSLGKSITIPFMGLASGVAIVAAARNIMNFDRSLTKLAINGRLTKKEQFELREEIGKLGVQFGKSREDVLGGLDAIVQRTGDIGFARDVMKDLALASTATGTSMEDLGALASNLQQKLAIGPEGLAEALNIINVQGKEGAFTLEKMASLGERLFAASGRIGMKGVGDLRKYGALIQMSRMGTGSEEQATTAMERVLDAIIDKQDVIRKKAKFDVFSNRSLQQFKSIDKIVKGIIIGTGGNEKDLGDIFGAEGVRGIAELARLYRETKGFDFFDKLTNSDAGRANETLKDSARAMEDSASKFDKLMAILENASDKLLAKSIENLSVALNELINDPRKVDDFIEDMGNIGAAIAGLVKIVGGSLGVLEKFWSVVDKIETAGDPNSYSPTKGVTSGRGNRLHKNDLARQMRIANPGKGVFDWAIVSGKVAENNGSKSEQVVNITVSDTMQVRASATSNGSTSAVRVNKKDNSFLMK
jgi:TP901 family phage tail tape measure protein